LAGNAVFMPSRHSRADDETGNPKPLDGHQVFAEYSGIVVGND
jgi:hypothetical protein